MHVACYQLVLQQYEGYIYMYIKYVPNTHFRHPPSAVGVPPENDYLDNESNLEAITAHFEEFLDFELTTHGMLPPLACSV